METQNLNKQRIVLLLLTSLALSGCGAPQGGAPDMAVSDRLEEGIDQDEIFADASDEAVSESVDPQSEGAERARRQRFVRVNEAALKNAISRFKGLPIPLRLNLFDDTKVVVLIDSVERKSDKNFVAQGILQGEKDSAVTLVLNEEAFVGNIVRPEREEQFEIRFASNGLHKISIPEIDEHAHDESQCGAHEDPEQAKAMAAGEELLSERLNQQPESYVMSNPVINMLVAYTPAARYRQGGTNAMVAHIQMGTADTNRALTNSGATFSVRLAGTLETRQNESGNMLNDLYALQRKYDGKWDEVHPARTRLKADQVSLVGAYSTTYSVAGIGFINASPSSAFTVTKASQFSQYTFSHELGHNIGLDHHHGYVNYSGRFRTIMAYGSYSRILRFSNPNRTYNGYRTGTSYQNSVSILNRRAGYVAGFF
jgi:peptidyl-Asp metalloendopeptidase